VLVNIQAALKLALIYGSFLRALSESQFFAQQKMVELRSSPEMRASLRPFTSTRPAVVPCHRHPPRFSEQKKRGLKSPRFLKSPDSHYSASAFSDR
jgi:hypothetical protein